VLAAARSWMCVHNEPRPLSLGKHPLRIMPTDLLRVQHTVPWAQGALSAGRIFYEGFMAQLMLRPAAVLRAYVEAYEAKHGLDQAPAYPGVHLRMLEGDCFNKNTIKSMRTRMLPRFSLADGARNMSLHDVCELSDNHILGWLDQLGVPAGAPLMIGHDGQNKRRLQKLHARFQVLVPGDEIAQAGSRLLLPSGRRVHPVFIDMLLMLRATAFIGNPQSTLSYNVAAVRAKPPTSSPTRAKTLRAISWGFIRSRRRGGTGSWWRRRNGSSCASKAERAMPPHQFRRRMSDPTVRAYCMVHPCAATWIHTRTDTRRRRWPAGCALQTLNHRRRYVITYRLLRVRRHQDVIIIPAMPHGAQLEHAA
jgi:hypothetical protein